MAKQSHDLIMHGLIAVNDDQQIERWWSHDRHGVEIGPLPRWEELLRRFPVPPSPTLPDAATRAAEPGPGREAGSGAPAPSSPSHGLWLAPGASPRAGPSAF